MNAHPANEFDNDMTGTHIMDTEDIAEVVLDLSIYPLSIIEEVVECPNARFGHSIEWSFYVIIFTTSSHITLHYILSYRTDISLYHELDFFLFR
jgi:hypothetical protein